MYNTCRDIQKRRINEENLKQNDENAPNETGALGTFYIGRDKPGKKCVKLSLKYTGTQKWPKMADHWPLAGIMGFNQDDFTSGILPFGCNELYTVTQTVTQTVTFNGLNFKFKFLSIYGWSEYWWAISYGPRKFEFWIEFCEQKPR